MNNYKFTTNWFNTQVGIDTIFTLDIKNEFHVLEIGSFEGRSTVWFLDNILSHSNSTITCVDPWTKYTQDTDSFNSYFKETTKWNFTNSKDLFLYNIKESGNKDKVIIKHGFSHELLPTLITEKKQYDFIFIDGNHTAPFVLTDTIMSWYTLKPGGIMVFDDYIWPFADVKNLPTTTPKIAVDSFIVVFKDYLEVLFMGDRVAIKKIK
jgi:predicted O-methyltransferase YrrM